MKAAYKILVLIVIFNYYAAAQPALDSLRNWQIKGVANINLTQGAVSNWTEGGDNYISALNILKLSANYKKDNSSWANAGEFRYGAMIASDKTKEKGMKLVKTDDRIDIYSTYGQHFFGKWDMTVMLNFKSQFAKGYDYPNDSVVISDFLSPANIYFALGFEYKQKDYLSVMLSPVTSKTMIVANPEVDETKYGIEKGERSKREIGIYLKTNYKVTLFDNVIMNNKLILFSNYLENMQNVDVDYQVDFTMKVNTFIQASLRMYFVYDDDIEIPVYKYINYKKTKVGVTKGLQFKEMLAIGFVFTLKNALKKIQ
jgi:hypothetical protein